LGCACGPFVAATAATVAAPPAPAAKRNFLREILDAEDDITSSFL
jgi:hypothetical protein